MFLIRSDTGSVNSGGIEEEAAGFNPGLGDGAYGTFMAQVTKAIRLNGRSG